MYKDPLSTAKRIYNKCRFMNEATSTSCLQV